MPVRRAVVVGVAMFLVASVVSVSLGMAWRQAMIDAATERSRDEVRRDAGEIVAQVFSVSSDSWRSDRERAQELVGGEFAVRYATELTRPPADGADSVVWRPEAVGIIDADPDHVRALIRATVTTVPARTADPVTEKRSVTAEFGREDNRWTLTSVEVLS